MCVCVCVCVFLSIFVLFIFFWLIPNTDIFQGYTELMNIIFTSDNLRNPQEEEEEEERGKGRSRGEFRGKQIFPHQLAPRGNTHSKTIKKQSINLPLQPERGQWATPSSNQVRPHWQLKRNPPEIIVGKSSDNGAEAYLDVRVTNTSLNLTILNDEQREQMNETIREIGNRRSTANHLLSCQYLNVFRSVIFVFLFTSVFS